MFKAFSIWPYFISTSLFFPTTSTQESLSYQVENTGKPENQEPSSPSRQIFSKNYLIASPGSKEANLFIDLDDQKPKKNTFLEATIESFSLESKENTKLTSDTTKKQDPNLLQERTEWWERKIIEDLKSNYLLLDGVGEDYEISQIKNIYFHPKSEGRGNPESEEKTAPIEKTYKSITFTIELTKPFMPKGDFLKISELPLWIAPKISKASIKSALSYKDIKLPSDSAKQYSFNHLWPNSEIDERNSFYYLKAEGLEWFTLALTVSQCYMGWPEYLCKFISNGTRPYWVLLAVNASNPSNFKVLHHQRLFQEPRATMTLSILGDLDQNNAYEILIFDKNGLLNNIDPIILQFVGSAPHVIWRSFLLSE